MTDQAKLKKARDEAIKALVNSEGFLLVSIDKSGGNVIVATFDTGKQEAMIADGVMRFIEHREKMEEGSDDTEAVH